MEVGNLKENSITKNLLLNRTCYNCFYHTSPNKPLTIFCLKESESEYNTCEEWTSSNYNLLFNKSIKFVTKEDVEFAEKEIEKIKDKHNL
jgi:hypothetical protein